MQEMGNGKNKTYIRILISCSRGICLWRIWKCIILSLFLSLSFSFSLRFLLNFPFFCITVWYWKNLTLSHTVWWISRIWVKRKKHDCSTYTSLRKNPSRIRFSWIRYRNSWGTQTDISPKVKKKTNKNENISNIETRLLLIFFSCFAHLRTTDVLL